jgi:flagellar hook protein FlgE
MSFEIALSGINAVNTQLDTISNNIANTGTYGFKSSRANFSAMVAGRPQRRRGGLADPVHRRGGSTLNTGRSLDAAIQGRGFFALKDSAGGMSYSRVGNFVVDKTGVLVDSAGRKVQGYASPRAAPPAVRWATSACPAARSRPRPRPSWTTWPTCRPTGPRPRSPLRQDRRPELQQLDGLGGLRLAGQQHTLTQYFVKSGANQVNVHYTMDGADLGTTTTLQFSTDGVLTSPTAPVSLALGTPQAPVR